MTCFSESSSFFAVLSNLVVRTCLLLPRVLHRLPIARKRQNPYTPSPDSFMPDTWPFRTLLAWTWPHPRALGRTRHVCTPLPRMRHCHTPVACTSAVRTRVARTLLRPYACGRTPPWPHACGPNERWAPPVAQKAASVGRPWPGHAARLESGPTCPGPPSRLHFSTLMRFILVTCPSLSWLCMHPNYAREGI